MDKKHIEDVFDGWYSLIWKCFSDQSLHFRSGGALLMRGSATPFFVNVMSWELSSIKLFCPLICFWPGTCKQAIAAVVKYERDQFVDFSLI